MQIQLKDLGMMMQLLLGLMKQRGLDVIDLGDLDEYWIVNPPEWTDFEKQPDPEVGSMEDDLSELLNMRNGRIPTPVDLDRLASVLRAISAQIAPP